MTQTCQVCSHEKRQEIDDAIVQGKSIRAIAGLCGLGKSSIHRHRACLSDKLAKADARIGGRIARRVEGLIVQLEEMAKAARDEKQAAAFLMVARELRPTYELGAKLSGEMQAASVAAFLAALGVQSESEVRDALHVVRSANQPSLEECREEGVALLRMVLVEHPEWRAGVLAQLESAVPLLQSHDAENGNGSAV